MTRRVPGAHRAALLIPLALLACLVHDVRSEDRVQPRTHGARVSVDPSRVRIDDGDTLEIRWSRGDVEVVRILGIDTPETRHLEHDIPYAQPFGEEARRFAIESFAEATRVELLRSATLDPYGRTLAYVFVDGHNYSVLAVRARLALENVSHFGDNGLPREAAAVLAAAEAAGPVAFEPPYRYRARMRELSKYLREQGTYPEE